MASKTINIMLVDDHIIVSEGLRSIIEKENNFKIVTITSNGIEAVEKAKLFNPHIIIMDINMPTMNGIDALKTIKDQGISSKVIILTGRTDKEYIIAATKLGAKGYLFKSCNTDDLINAIREVSIGRTYIDQSVAYVLTQNTYSEKKNVNIELEKVKALSRREYEVLALISAGFNNKDIGSELFISEKTVKNHITKLFKKIEVEDRVQATIFAYQNGIKYIKD